MNPTRKTSRRFSYTRVKCAKCGDTFGANNIRRHRAACKGPRTADVAVGDADAKQVGQ